MWSKSKLLERYKHKNLNFFFESSTTASPEGSAFKIHITETVCTYTSVSLADFCLTSLTAVQVCSKRHYSCFCSHWDETNPNKWNTNTTISKAN